MDFLGFWGAAVRCNSAFFIADSQMGCNSEDVAGGVSDLYIFPLEAGQVMSFDNRSFYADYDNRRFEQGIYFNDRPRSPKKEYGKALPLAKSLNPVSEESPSVMPNTVINGYTAGSGVNCLTFSQNALYHEYALSDLSCSDFCCNNMSNEYAVQNLESFLGKGAADVKGCDLINCSEICQSVSGNGVFRQNMIFFEARSNKGGALEMLCKPDAIFERRSLELLCRSGAAAEYRNRANRFGKTALNLREKIGGYSDKNYVGSHWEEAGTVGLGDRGKLWESMAAGFGGIASGNVRRENNLYFEAEGARDGRAEFNRCSYSLPIDLTGGEVRYQGSELLHNFRGLFKLSFNAADMLFSSGIADNLTESTDCGGIGLGSFSQTLSAMSVGAAPSVGTLGEKKPISDVREPRILSAEPNIVGTVVWETANADINELGERDFKRGMWADSLMTGGESRIDFFPHAKAASICQNGEMAGYGYITRLCETAGSNICSIYAAETAAGIISEPADSKTVVCDKELRELRNVVMRESVGSGVTSANIKIDVSGCGAASGGIDMDELVQKLSEALGEAMIGISEGVHCI